VFCNLVFLLVFLVISATIGLFHTEANLRVDASCPACTFQSCSVAIDATNFYQQPELSLFDRTSPVEYLVRARLIVVNIPGRSPPAI